MLERKFKLEYLGYKNLEECGDNLQEFYFSPDIEGVTCIDELIDNMLFYLELLFTLDKIVNGISSDYIDTYWENLCTDIYSDIMSMEFNYPICKEVQKEDVEFCFKLTFLGK